MSLPLEDYALIGDTHTAALVGKDGSIDWLCLPRFDPGAVFAALLGDERHGRWLLAPAEPLRRVRRRYREGTLVLETEFETDSGAVRLVDFMPHRHRYADVVRIVEGLRGRVPVGMQLVMRFDHGWVVPWVRRVGDALLAVAGPDALTLRTPVETRGAGLTTAAEFAVPAGSRVPFSLTWHPSTDPPPARADAEDLLRRTESWWSEWSARCAYEGECTPDVQRSLLTLKALTYEPTGGIVAALTTSLPAAGPPVRGRDVGTGGGGSADRSPGLAPPLMGRRRGRAGFARPRR